MSAQTPRPTGPSFASVHGRDATEVHASDLTLDKFIDAATLTARPDAATARAPRCGRSC